MSDDSGFSQAQVDKIVKERLAEMKAQRDSARDEAAEFKKQLTGVTKERDTLQVRAERADTFEAELTQARQEFESAKGTWSKRDALRGVLNDKFDDDAAELLIAKHSKAEDAGDFGEWAKAQAEERAGLFGLLLGEKPAADPSAAPEVTPPQTPPGFAPPPPANRGAKGAPPPGPASVSVSSMDAGAWAAFKQENGLA